MIVFGWAKRRGSSVPIGRLLNAAAPPPPTVAETPSSWGNPARLREKYFETAAECMLRYALLIPRRPVYRDSTVEAQRVDSSTFSQIGRLELIQASRPLTVSLNFNLPARPTSPSARSPQDHSLWPWLPQTR